MAEHTAPAAETIARVLGVPAPHAITNLNPVDAWLALQGIATAQRNMHMAAADALTETSTREALQGIARYLDLLASDCVDRARAADAA